MQMLGIVEMVPKEVSELLPPGSKSALRVGEE